MSKRLAAALLFIFALSVPTLSRAASQVVPVEGTTDFWKGLSVGLVGAYMDYIEPGAMREYGKMYGVNIGYTQVNEISLLATNFSAEFVGGRIIYDGASVNLTTGVRTPNVTGASDYVFNLRGTVGLYREINSTYSAIPYIGLGYRDLNDKIDGSGSYNRNIGYIYVPVGGQVAGWIDDTWSFTFQADFDLVLIGTVVSKFSDLDSSAPDITNHNQGYGYRLEATLRKDMGRFSIHLTPFYQKWKMNKSDVVQLYINNQLNDLWEPANSNDMVGLNLGADF